MTLLQKVEAKGKALKERFPATTRPDWVVRELDLYREIYKELHASEIAKHDAARQAETYKRLEDFTETLEECFYQIMRFRPDFFELNSPAPSLVGAYAWLKLLKIMPEGIDRTAALKFFHDATPLLNNVNYEENRPTFAPAPKTGKYNIWQRIPSRK